MGLWIFLDLDQLVGTFIHTLIQYAYVDVDYIRRLHTVELYQYRIYTKHCREGKNKDP